MKQIVQSARSGELQLVDVPAPAPERGQVLIQNHFSVMSPGTEKLSMDFAQKSLVGKARSRPDLVGQVLKKVRQEGPLPTFRTVVNRLDSPQPLGYSCAGTVIAVGEGVTRFSVGERVACAGAGYANHAELVVVPENLLAHVPDGLELDKAAFATLGAIALQGIRVADPTLGEVVVVVGLGLIGQLAVQLLVANGCRVLGVDIDRRRIEQALEQGAEWGAKPDELTEGWSHEATAGHGVDFALITASSETATPIELAAQLCRPKGRVVVVGAMPLNLDRRVFYEKELELRLSMSYGPGRYDRRYEEVGLDYPLPYVRWTENRNLQTFLDLASKGKVDPESLDTETVPFSEAEAAYEKLSRGERSSLAVLFRYSDAPSTARTQELKSPSSRKASPGNPGLAFLGAGNYAKAVLLPALASLSGIRHVSLVTATGPSATRTAERFGFERCGTHPDDAILAEDVDAVFVATRHHLHAQQAISALKAGKAVWLEKPVGLSLEEVEKVCAAAHESPLMVGYNRRFSDHARVIREKFSNRIEPLSIQYTVAAGPTPRGTWITDPHEGGGRVIGEMCHFIDLCSYLTQSTPVRVYAQASGQDMEMDDSVQVLITYADGSTASIAYLARSHAQLPKEYFMVSSGGETASCENFKTTRILGGKDVKHINQDKGQATAVKAFIESVRTGSASPFTVEEILGTSKVTFGILESIRTNNSVTLGPGR